MSRRGVVCVVVGAVVFGFAGGDGVAGGHAKAWADGTPVVWSEDEMPELPLDRYEFGATDQKTYDRMGSATQLLTQRCMVRHGFADFPRDPKFPGMATAYTSAMVAVSTGPVGPWDLGKASRWGYGWDPAKKFRAPEPAGREMTTEESAVYYGDRQSERSGCSGEAYTRIERGVRDRERMWTYVSRRTEAVRKQADRDPTMRRAYKAWADCVVDKGFKRYADPVQAFGDKAWRRGQDGNTTRGKRELGTAVADIACKRAHNTGGVWWTVARRLQRHELALHRAEFEAVRTDGDRLLANVRAVLETT
ncbi:hypothetical protein ACIREE_02300 [Streptomyces sp. NPDC102467]|uniref:hypothetical protein n=1 Tax=Streptomyces sp. NPDC102467 TaxID=3366179 RepID=UPI0037F24714